MVVSLCISIYLKELMQANICNMTEINIELFPTICIYTYNVYIVCMYHLNCFSAVDLFSISVRAQHTYLLKIAKKQQQQHSGIKKWRMPSMMATNNDDNDSYVVVAPLNGNKQMPPLQVSKFFFPRNFNTWVIKN